MCRCVAHANEVSLVLTSAGQAGISSYSIRKWPSVGMDFNGISAFAVNEAI